MWNSLRRAPAADLTNRSRCRCPRRPYSMATADFNGDGNPDLAVALPESSMIALLWGNGDGTFRGPIELAAGRGQTRLLAADADGDGNLDLATATNDGRAVRFFLSRGDGGSVLATSRSLSLRPDSLWAI